MSARDDPSVTPLPLFEQIKQSIVRRIDSGELLPGDSAPSERALAAKFNVSRMTARRAIVELQNEGYVRRGHGKRTVVSRRKLEESVSDLVSFTQDMRNRGFIPTTRILRKHRIVADDELSCRLNLPPETNEVLLLERLRLASNDPMSHEITYLPLSEFPGIGELDLSGSLYAVLTDHFERKPVSAHQTIEGLKADQRTALLLGIEPDDVIIKLRRISYDASSVPIEYVEADYRADRYVFAANLKIVPTT